MDTYTKSLNKYEMEQRKIIEKNFILNLPDEFETRYKYKKPLKTYIKIETIYGEVYEEI